MFSMVRFYLASGQRLFLDTVITGGIGAANTSYKRTLDAVLKERAGRRDFVRSELQVDGEVAAGELSELFWTAVNGNIPSDHLDAPLVERIPEHCSETKLFS